MVSNFVKTSFRWDVQRSAQNVNAKGPFEKPLQGSETQETKFHDCASSATLCQSIWDSGM